MSTCKTWSILALLAFTYSGVAEMPKLSVGITPVYDGGGNAFGEVLSQHLTLFTYEELLKSETIYPTLLNPGGVFSPLDPSWVFDYLHETPEIRLVLIATLKPARVAKGDHAYLPVDLELFDAHSGDSIATWSIGIDIDSKKTRLQYGKFEETTSNIDHYGNVQKTYSISPSRAFEKQPLGKACAKLASDIRDSLESKLTSVKLARAVEAAQELSEDKSGKGGGSCAVHVNITYAYKHSASQSYVLVANGLDETTTVKDGIASFDAPEGQLLLQFTLQDAPYKMQFEPFYQASMRHTCTKSTLTIDLGPGGDAHLSWE